MNWKEQKTIDKIGIPNGFFYDGAFGGIKAGSKKLDIGWIVSEVPATCAAVFTTNKMAAAPVKLSKDVLHQNNKIQAIVVNSGNANACTGLQGYEDALTMQQFISNKLKIDNNQVMVASTGVIGQLLPMQRLEEGMSYLKKEKAIDKFSTAILTTDLSEKACSVTIGNRDETITITGIAKGSGMIHPNMATMLGFITTDALIEQELLGELLKNSVDQSFHCISVDGDTSTNDMVVALANGYSNVEKITVKSSYFEMFSKALTYVCIHLAKEIARDGEGATKLVEVIVKEAATSSEAKLAAKTIVTSSLVKTALFGCDANWGRIASAVGQSQVEFVEEKLQIEMCGVKVIENGLPIEINEEYVTKLLSKKEVNITVSLGCGIDSATVYGCDLSYDYVKINGDYRS